MKDILERIAETSFRNDSLDDLRCRLLDCAEIIMNLRKDQAEVDWLATTEQNIGSVMQPTETFIETRRERFEASWAIECAARKHNNTLDKNTAWVTWQVCEALCCNAFFDAGAIVPNVMNSGVT